MEFTKSFPNFDALYQGLAEEWGLDSRKQFDQKFDGPASSRTLRNFGFKIRPLTQDEILEFNVDDPAHTYFVYRSDETRRYLIQRMECKGLGGVTKYMVRVDSPYMHGKTDKLLRTTFLREHGDDPTEKSEKRDLRQQRKKLHQLVDRTKVKKG